ncbi:hypothetical protein [Limosilactobacillus reuteri]
MKIKEAIKIINSTKTARASLGKEEIYFYADGLDRSDYFLMMPQNVNNWDDVDEDFEALYSITLKDLARVMDVIQRLLDTPIKERFPEKKYRLVVKRDNPFCPKYVSNIITELNGIGFDLSIDEKEARIFSEKELNQIKGREPSLAPAIDAMKEPAEGKTDDND